MATQVKARRPETAAAAVRAVRLGPRDVVSERRSDGTILLRSPHPLAPYPAKLTERLEYWAAAAPARTFLAQRTPSGWRKLGYGETLDCVRRIGAALLRRDLSRERPLVLLSGNDIEHALLGLAAMHVGIPYAPISPAYALMSNDFGKLRSIIDLLTPGLVFAADGQTYARAIDAVVPSQVEVVVTRNPTAGRATTSFETLLAPRATGAAETAHASVGPDTIAKFLFTSGSTGTPKAVINTQRMWCSNQAMILSQLAFFAEEPPVIVDWAPWHHTAGGNHNFGFVLYNGGTLYTELRKTFFRELKVLWFAGAALAQSVFDEMQELALAACGERIMFLTGLGSTETAPMAIARMWQSKDSTNMGVPVLGVELKLVPSHGKLEARVRGPNITPGYWRQGEFTAQAFDEEGFYKLGDALKFEDSGEPRAGLLFDGRVAEDFKLATGTWVNVGPLRGRLLQALEPYARDVVIAGADRNEIGALIFPNFEACRALAAGPTADVTSDARVREELRARLAAFASTSTGSSNRVCRAILLAEPPSLDTGEMTDKGSINQRAVLERRAALVDELYRQPLSPRVIATEEQA